VGPTSNKSTTQVSTEVGTQVSTEVYSQVKLSTEEIQKLLDYCKEPRSRQEMQTFCGIKTAEYFRKNIIRPLVDIGLLRLTIPDKPTSSKQRYATTANGLLFAKSENRSI